MPRAVIALGVVVTGLAVLAPMPVQAQDWTRREFPLAPPNARSNFVAPYFDGFYQNDDGTYTLSFGFMNRNDEAVIEIPLGPNNFIEPAEYDGAQPTSFPVVSYGGFGGPRERGVFGVVVPADFDGDVWWTLTTDGYTTRVPGRLRGRFQGVIGFEGAYALSTTTMAEGSLRPLIQFTEDGPAVWGLPGIEHPERFTTSVGEPIEVRFWAFDRGERELGDVNMTLWKYQGPVGGVIAFESLVEAAPVEPEAPPRRGRRPVPPGPIDIGASVAIPSTGPAPNIGHFKAMFDTPGEYVIRVRIDNFSSGDSSPGNQCCWTNGYVNVTVTE
ncbi:MAG: hypothetical protein OEN00_07015 [Gemmatimonadota bacterium]|nr:hypothetical protein [Gemmatimonadota bacterium]